MIWLRNTKITSLLSFFCLLVLLMIPAQVFAQAYGEGAYGACGYGQSCPSSGGSNNAAETTVQTTPATDPEIVLLNSFDEYFVAEGKKLELAAEQIVYFDINESGQTVRHSATIKEIGKDFVVLTIASTPRDVTIYVGQVKQYDVTGDDINDIEIALNSIKDSKTTITFRQLNKPTSDTVATTAKLTKPFGWTLVLYIFALLGGLTLFWVLLAKRRRKRREDRNV